MRKKLCAALVLAVSLLAVGCGSSTPNQVEAVETEKTVIEPSTEETQENLSDQVTYETVESKNLCLMTFTNNSDKDVEVEVNFVFDNNGSKEDAGYGHLYCLGSGKSGVIAMKKPTDDTDMPIEGVTTEYSVTINESGLFDENGSFTDDISCEDSADSDGNVTITVTNNSDKDLSSVLTAIVYYNGDEPVWYDDYGMDMAAGSDLYWTFDQPHYYDVDCTPIEYDHYEIIINDAYISQY